MAVRPWAGILMCGLGLGVARELSLMLNACCAPRVSQVDPHSRRAANNGSAGWMHNTSMRACECQHV